MFEKSLEKCHESFSVRLSELNWHDLIIETGVIYFTLKLGHPVNREDEGGLLVQVQGPIYIGINPACLI